MKIKNVLLLLLITSSGLAQTGQWSITNNFDLYKALYKYQDRIKISNSIILVDLQNIDKNNYNELKALTNLLNEKNTVITIQDKKKFIFSTQDDFAM